MTYKERKAEKERKRLIIEECIKDTLEEMKKIKESKGE